MDNSPLLELSPKSNGDEKLEIRKEVKRQLHIAVPMLVVNFLEFAIQLSSVMLVGHLGKLPLASASLAASACNVTGFILLMGLSAALETLCGQAYGAKQYRLLGVYLQRAVFVLLLVCLPISLLWFNMGYVLRALGQDPAISELAGEFARLLIPGLVAQAFAWPMVKFLQSQSAVVPMTFCTVAAVLVHVPLCWLLLYKFQVGPGGAAISISVSYWLNAIFLALYVRFSARCRESFTGFSGEALTDFSGFFKLAVPAAVMICLEWWSFEFITLLSGLLPDPELETSTTVSMLSTLSISDMLFLTLDLFCSMNTLQTFYMIPYSLSAAASTRAANELGAGRPSAAKHAVEVTLCMGLIDSTLIVTLILSTCNHLGWLFSSDADVVNHIGDLFRVAIFIIAFDPIQGVLTGVSRGCGWQAVGAGANLLAFYVIGLPVAIVLAFVFNMHGMGLWIGITCGNAAQTLTLCLVTFFTDWNKLAENARARLF